MRIRCEVDTTVLMHNLVAYIKATGKTASEAVTDVIVLVQRSAAANAPAAKSGLRGSSRIIRQGVVRYRRGVREVALDEHPTAKGDADVWAILARRGKPLPAGAERFESIGKKRYWLFPTKSAANQHKKVDFRGVFKAGFWQAIDTLGAQSANYPNKQFLRGFRLASVDIATDKPSITTHNLVRSVSQTYGDLIKRVALNKANSQLATIITKTDSELAKQWGVMRWSKKTQAYTGATEW